MLAPKDHPTPMSRDLGNSFCTAATTPLHHTGQVTVASEHPKIDLELPSNAVLQGNQAYGQGPQAAFLEPPWLSSEIGVWTSGATAPPPPPPPPPPPGGAPLSSREALLICLQNGCRLDSTTAPRLHSYSLTALWLQPSCHTNLLLSLEHRSLQSCSCCITELGHATRQVPNRWSESSQMSCCPPLIQRVH